jgi:hypothetical protein
MATAIFVFADLNASGLEAQLCINGMKAAFFCRRASPRKANFVESRCSALEKDPVSRALMSDL